MEIDNLIKKFNYKINKIRNNKSSLNKNIDAEYWLLLGESNALSDCIVDIIEEYNKVNKLNEFHKKNLNIHKI